LQLYERAQDALRNTNSTFDKLWIDLKRADALLRPTSGDPSAQRATALQLLDSVMKESKRLELHWVFGQALTSQANASMQMPDITQAEVFAEV
jgi:hypothetical protein